MTDAEWQTVMNEMYGVEPGVRDVGMWPIVWICLAGWAAAAALVLGAIWEVVR